MRRFSEAERAEIWDLFEQGVSERQIAVRMGRNKESVRQFLIDNAGRRPRPPTASKLRLPLAEREVISRGLAAAKSLRAIAAGMGRAPSTVCREVNATGGTSHYRALSAERAARQPAWSRLRVPTRIAPRARYSRPEREPVGSDQFLVVIIESTNDPCCPGLTGLHGGKLGFITV